MFSSHFAALFSAKCTDKNTYPKKRTKKAGGQGLKISFTRLDFWHFLDYYRLQ